jgi:hypothetical protein
MILLMEVYIEKIPPKSPNIMIAHWIIIKGIDNFPLNSFKYRSGGRTNAIIVDPRDPAMLRKS